MSIGNLQSCEPLDILIRNSTKATDAAGLPLGGRKPGDAPSTDLAKTVPGVAGIGGAPDAPAPSNDDEKSSLKIKIHLDLDVDVHLTARVKGDIIIGLL